MTQDKAPMEGHVIQIQVGRQSALQAEIRWTKS